MWCCLFLGLSFIVRQESAGRNVKLSQLGQFNGIRSRSGAQLTQQYPRQYRISTNIMRPRDFTPRSYRGSVKFSTLSPYGVAISKTRLPAGAHQSGATALRWCNKMNAISVQPI
jgi:hypothetical protein